MKKSIKAIRYFFAIIIVLCLSTISIAQQVTSKELYQCPMKCEGDKTYDKQGKCPVCGMDLEKINAPAVSEENNSMVKIVGVMMNVMHKNELFATIDLDTISDKKHLYGLGPLENLKGEILIVDGKSFISKVAPDGSMKMQETFKAKAPFFVFENVINWNEIDLPDSIHSIPQLENFLNETTKNVSRPFAFKLTATVESAKIHVMNLPDGTQVHSPEDAHKSQKLYDLKNEKVTLIGFFSTEHQGVFTHHDSYVHIHLINDIKTKMGHLEELNLNTGSAKIFIPAN